ncbi:MAG TPA: cytidylate kinase-like family protein [Acidimicrobiales bacterium]|nr:cytidylate kinase-like family protein [Acidimicrobiales bacterium]
MTDGHCPIKVVTISASYGAGGTVVGPQVAARLGLPFAERALRPAEVERLSEGLADNEQEQSWLERLIAGAARLPAIIGVSLPPPTEGMTEEERFRAQNETIICELMAGQGGVVLGRGAAAFLGRQRGCYHVRLDGPAEARIAQAARIEDISEEEAARRQAVTDRARTLYNQRFYNRDLNDASLYHLVVDTTTVPLSTATELIVTAVKAATSQA